MREPNKRSSQAGGCNHDGSPSDRFLAPADASGRRLQVRRPGVREPYGQTEDGRDHNHKGYTIWMAGGGVKRGLAFGQIDDFRYAGREMRLTNSKGNVVREILA